MTWLHTILLGIVEGLTEFIPVSSTGHMILVSHFLGIAESEFTKAFEVIIQFGAILTVVVLFWRRFLPNVPFYRKLIVGFLPTGILGFFLKERVDIWMESPTLVATSLILGGFVLIWIDRFRPGTTGSTIEELTDAKCIKLGLWQSLAMVPGVSRSGSTIVGALLMGMKKSEAAEYSFFLAVPTMAAATAYKLLKMILSKTTFSGQEWSQLGVGFVIAFIVAGIAVKLFLDYVRKHGFAPFGYYRIVVGIIILATLAY